MSDEVKTAIGAAQQDYSEVCGGEAGTLIDKPVYLNVQGGFWKGTNIFPSLF